MSAPHRIARNQRKQDLLLASRLLRQETRAALDVIGARVDGVVASTRRVRAALKNPALLVGLASAAAGLLLRRGRRPAERSAQPVVVAAAARESLLGALLRWGLLGWRAWRMIEPLREQWIDTRRRGQRRR